MKERESFQTTSIYFRIFYSLKNQRKAVIDLSIFVSFYSVENNSSFYAQQLEASLFSLNLIHTISKFVVMRVLSTLACLSFGAIYFDGEYGTVLYHKFWELLHTYAMRHSHKLMTTARTCLENGAKNGKRAINTSRRA